MTRRGFMGGGTIYTYIYIHTSTWWHRLFRLVSSCVLKVLNKVLKNNATYCVRKAHARLLKG